jgi:hypothetical protein
MATLAKGLQISQPVVGWIMVKVRSRQHYPGCANSDVVAKTWGAARLSETSGCGKLNRNRRVRDVD